MLIFLVSEIMCVNGSGFEALGFLSLVGTIGPFGASWKKVWESWIIEPPTESTARDSHFWHQFFQRGFEAKYR